jgi:hypothetical protein
MEQIKAVSCVVVTSFSRVRYQRRFANFSRNLSYNSLGNSDLIIGYHSFIHPPMSLQPFVGLWSLLQFRNLSYTGGRTPWTRVQPVSRPIPTHRTTQTE